MRRNKHFANSISAIILTFIILCFCLYCNLFFLLRELLLQIKLFAISKTRKLVNHGRSCGKYGNTQNIGGLSIHNRWPLKVGKCSIFLQNDNINKWVFVLIVYLFALYLTYLLFIDPVRLGKIEDRLCSVLSIQVRRRFSKKYNCNFCVKLSTN